MPWYGILDNFGTPNYDTDLSHGHLGPRYAQKNLNGDLIASGNGLKTVLRTSGDFSTSAAIAQSLTPGYSTWTGILENQGGIVAVHDCDAILHGGDGVPLGRWFESVNLSVDLWLPQASSQGNRSIGGDTISVGYDGGMAGIVISPDTSLTPPYCMILINRSSTDRVSFYAVSVDAHGDPPTLTLLDFQENAADYLAGGTMEVYYAMGRVHIYYPSPSAYSPIILEGFVAPDITAYSVVFPGVYAELGGSNEIYFDNLKACSAVFDEIGPEFPAQASSYVAKIAPGTPDGTKLRNCGNPAMYGSIKVLSGEISTRGVTYPRGYTYAHAFNPSQYKSSKSFTTDAKVTLNVSNTTNSIGLSALGHFDISATDVLIFYPIELDFSYSGGNIVCQLIARQHESSSVPDSGTVLDSKTDIDPDDWTADGDSRVGYISWEVEYDSIAEEITSTVTLPGDVTWETTQSAPAWYTPGPYAGFFVTGTASEANDLYLSFVDSEDVAALGYGPITTVAPDAPSISTPTLAPVRFTGSTFSDDDDSDILDYSEWQLTSYSDTTYASIIETVYMDGPTTGDPYSDFTLVDGNEYRARVRYCDSYGNLSDWSTDITFTATFSADSVDEEDLPSWPSTLPHPSDASTESVEFKTRITPFEYVGVESRQKVHSTQIVLWHLVYKVLTAEQYNILKTFFISRCGAWGAFYFQDPLDASQIYRMRFASDKLTREIYSSVLTNVEIDLVQLSEYSQQVS